MAPDEINVALPADARFKEKLIEAVAGTFQTLIRYGVALGIAYCAYLSIKELAGKVTLADIDAYIGFSQSGDSDEAFQTGSPVKMFFAFALPWFIAVVCFFYGRNQKRLRGNVIQRLSGRIKELETHFDKNRSSSTLSERGETNNADI